MGFDFDSSDIDLSSTLKAEHVNNASDSIVDFINKGIWQDELKEPKTVVDPLSSYEKEGWLDSRLIYRPEFYGSPSPRMIAQTGQTHFRETPNDWSSGACFNHEISGTSPIAVPGTATTLKLRHKAVVNIMCSFYAFEFGGVYESEKFMLDEGGLSGNYGGYETNRAGSTFLSINGSKKASTESQIFTSFVGPRRGYVDFDKIKLAPYRYTSRGFIFLPMIGRHMHHFTYQQTLNEGVHDIGLVFEARQGTGTYSWISKYKHDKTSFRDYFNFPKDEEPKFLTEKHVFFLARNLIVDAYYLKNTPV